MASKAAVSKARGQSAKAAAAPDREFQRVHLQLNLLDRGTPQQAGGRVYAWDLLGGASIFRRDIPRGPFDALIWEGIIRSGMPVGVIEHLQRAVGLTQNAILRFLGINERSLQRRRGAEALLTLDQGVRVASFTQMVERSIEVMGDAARATEWLNAPNAALRGARPMELAATPYGAQAALDTLNAIEHGMFA